MEFTISQIAELLKGEVEGDGSGKITHLDKIEEGTQGGISFLSNLKYEPFIYETACTAVVVSEDFRPARKVKPTLIKVKNAYTGFTQLLEIYEQMSKVHNQGIEQPSFVGKGSKLGDNIYLAAFSYIGHHTQIGNNVKIYPHTYIGNNVQIGDGSVIYSGVKIYDNCKIGKNCELHAGAVIGSDGFGFAPEENGTYKNIPQLGNVVLEDNVSIGANSTVDCATLGSTLIQKGAKIDNLVQIAHNVVIGENTVIASQAGVSGSTKIGKNCVIAGKAGIVGHLTIADNTTIGANTGISKSVLKQGKVLLGYMGYEIKDFLKSYAVFKKLPDLQNKIKELEKKQ